MSFLSSGQTNNRLRIMNPFYAMNWQEVNDTNNAADEIIQAPEKHLLTQAQLYEAEGGHGGLALTLFTMLAGCGAVFGSSVRMSNYWRSGSMHWKEWFCLGATALTGHYVGQQAAINMVGNPVAYTNHWIAYGHVKSGNRW